MAALIDSSVWTALFLNFDAQHGKAARLLPTLEGVLYVPYCVVAEVTTILAYKHSKDQANLFLKYLDANRDITLLDDTLQDEISFFQTLSQRISFTDAALIFLSQKLNARLITFDRQLARIAQSSSS